MRLKKAAFGLVAVFLLACNGHHDSNSVVPDTSALDDFVGTWKVTKADPRLEQNCTNPIFVPFYDDLVLRGIIEVTRNGSVLSAKEYDLCGRLRYTGVGEVDTSLSSVPWVIYQYSWKIDPSDPCSPRLDEANTGFLNPNGDTGMGDRIEGGDAVFTLFSTDSCGGQFTCNPIPGTYLAERCPPADCSFQSCL